MPWCPQCGAEYVPGCRTCGDCQGPLVDKLPESGQVTYSDKAGDPGEWKLLLNVRSSQEADLLVSRLESEGIPVLKQAQGAGQYLEVFMGTAIDIDLYVPEACWSQAQSLLSSTGQAFEAAPRVVASTSTPATAGLGTGRKLLIALLLVPILIYLCATVYNALIGLWKSFF